MIIIISDCSLAPNLFCNEICNSILPLFRHMVFSDDGATLLGCANDGLHVVGWEPARVFDTVHGHWGQIHDITVAQTQLVSYFSNLKFYSNTTIIIYL